MKVPHKKLNLGRPPGISLFILNMIQEMAQDEVNYIRKRLLELQSVKGQLNEKHKLRTRLMTLTQIGFGHNQKLTTNN